MRCTGYTRLLRTYQWKCRGQPCGPWHDRASQSWRWTSQQSCMAGSRGNALIIYISNIFETHLDHNKPTLAEGGTLHGEGGRSPRIPLVEIKIIGHFDWLVKRDDLKQMELIFKSLTGRSAGRQWLAAWQLATASADFIVSTRVIQEVSTTTNLETMKIWVHW